MINTTAIKGQMEPWYYKNAKTYNTNLLNDAVKKDASLAAQKNQFFDFKAEYEKAAQKLGLFDPTGTIHLVSDIQLSDQDRAIFEKMDKDGKAKGMEPMAVANIAFNYHLDEILANKESLEVPLDKSYLQRLLDDFKRANSPMQTSGIKPSTVQYFMNNFSNYAAGQYEANNGDYSEPSLSVKA